MPKSVPEIDWYRLFSFGKRHTILGVLYDGVVRLEGSDAPPRDMLMRWVAYAERIRRRNILLNHRAAKICSDLRDAGFRCCILKGQGNALMYSNPFLRMPGDIDIWVDGDRKCIDEYVDSIYGLKGAGRYHHAECRINDVDVEFHCIPCTVNNPIYNLRLQNWFNKNADRQFSNMVELVGGDGKVAVPTEDFNVVYQLVHMFHHFFDEGIGLRQMLDYYYLLMRLRMGDADAEVLSSLLRNLGLYGFAGAVMYVLENVAGLEKERMIVPVDETRGRVLLDEIVDGGNFGRYYTKYKGFTRKGMAEKYFLKIYRNMHFVKYYPAEALSEPIFRTWHFFWRICKGYK